MCIIIAKPAGIAMPTQKVLEHCASKNKDGIGIAWTTGGMIRIKKDFNDLEAFNKFVGVNVGKADAALIHFRIATSGLVDAGNCHPFPLTRRSKRLRAKESVTDIAVAHNGTFSDLKGHKKYSDTLIFIKNILADPIVRNNLHSEAIQELIKGYIDSSKLAVMDRLGNIMRFGIFWPDEGLFYSNGGFKEYEYQSQTEYSSMSSRSYQCNDCYRMYDLQKTTWDYKVQGWVCDACREHRLNLQYNNTKGES